MDAWFKDMFRPKLLSNHLGKDEWLLTNQRDQAEQARKFAGLPKAEGRDNGFLNENKDKKSRKISRVSGIGASGLAKHLPEIERLAWENTPDYDNWCGNACDRVSEYLKSQGVPHYRGMASHHDWLELEDGTIVDPTISQFGSTGLKDWPGTPKTAIIPPDHPLHNAEWYNGDDGRSRWHISSGTPREPKQGGTPAGTSEPRVVEHQAPGAGDESYFMWRRPFLYDRHTNIVHLGKPGDYHSDLPTSLNNPGGFISIEHPWWRSQHPDYETGIDWYNFPDNMAEIKNALAKVVPEAAKDIQTDRDDWGFIYGASELQIKRYEGVTGNHPGGPPVIFTPDTNTVHIGGPGAYHGTLRSWMDIGDLRGRGHEGRILKDEQGPHIYWYERPPAQAEAISEALGVPHRSTLEDDWDSWWEQASPSKAVDKQPWDWSPRQSAPPPENYGYPEDTPVFMDANGQIHIAQYGELLHYDAFGEAIYEPGTRKGRIVNNQIMWYDNPPEGWGHFRSPNGNPHQGTLAGINQEWPLEVFRSKRPPSQTEGHYFGQRTPVIYRNGKVYVGPQGGYHSDLAREMGFGYVDPANHRAAIMHDKEEPYLYWYNVPNGRVRDYVQKALGVSEEPKGWDWHQGASEPQVRLDQTPGTFQGFMWRRPVVYDSQDNLIHLGQPGSVHGDLYPEAWTKPGLHLGYLSDGSEEVPAGLNWFPSAYVRHKAEELPDFHGVVQKALAPHDPNALQTSQGGDEDEWGEWLGKVSNLDIYHAQNPNPPRAWLNWRKPILVDRAGKVYVGGPGNYHADIRKEFGLTGDEPHEGYLDLNENEVGWYSIEPENAHEISDALEAQPEDSWLSKTAAQVEVDQLPWQRGIHGKALLAPDGCWAIWGTGGSSDGRPYHSDVAEEMGLNVDAWDGYQPYVINPEGGVRILNVRGEIPQTQEVATEIANSIGGYVDNSVDWYWESSKTAEAKCPKCGSSTGSPKEDHYKCSVCDNTWPKTSAQGIPRVVEVNNSENNYGYHGTNDYPFQYVPDSNTLYIGPIDKYHMDAFGGVQEAADSYDNQIDGASGRVDPDGTFRLFDGFEHENVIAEALKNHMGMPVEKDQDWLSHTAGAIQVLEGTTQTPRHETWMARRPLIWNADARQVFLGQPGNYHMDVSREFEGAQGPHDRGYIVTQQVPNGLDEGFFWYGPKPAEHEEIAQALAPYEPNALVDGGKIEDHWSLEGIRATSAFWNDRSTIRRRTQERKLYVAQADQVLPRTRSCCDRTAGRLPQ
jgi:hypothetical protein